MTDRQGQRDMQVQVRASPTFGSLLAAGLPLHLLLTGCLRLASLLIVPSFTHPELSPKQEVSITSFSSVSAPLANARGLYPSDTFVQHQRFLREDLQQ